MKNKGFTLVELLAIIIVLGIISIIIIPKVIDQIEESKEKSALVSAGEYSKAITQYYLNNESDVSKTSISMSGKYTVENGILKKDSLEHKISFSGEAPKSGSLNIMDGEVKSGCLMIGNFAVVITDSKAVKAEKTICPSIVADHVVGGVMYYNPIDIKANPVYYNPTTGAYCTLTDYNANMTAATDSTYPTSGCLKWYAYSENSNGTINMIMAHNVASAVEWVTETDYTDGDTAGITYDDDITAWGESAKNYSGPVTALTSLKTATNGWSSTLNRSDSYINNGYTISYTGYKARLISAEEISAITSTSWNNSSYYLETGSLNQPSYGVNETSNYSWLYDYTTNCTTNGCSVSANLNNAISGYWTSTSSSDGKSWYTGNTGLLNSILVTNNTNNGIRPVITVSKN